MEQGVSSVLQLIDCKDDGIESVNRVMTVTDAMLFSMNGKKKSKDINKDILSFGVEKNKMENLFKGFQKNETYLTMDISSDNIKNKRELEIVDNYINYNDNCVTTTAYPIENQIKLPVIRLTPTSKLLAKKKYQCPYENCTKSYGKSSHLRSHLTWHTGIKPFVCREPNCTKAFTRSDELNRHMRTHTGEKPFECSQCIKKFSRSDHLNKHMATHAKHLKAAITLDVIPSINGNNIKKLKGTKSLMSMMPNAISSNNNFLLDMKNPTQLNYADGIHFMATFVDDMNKSETFLPENLNNEPANLNNQPFNIKLEQTEDNIESSNIKQLISLRNNNYSNNNNREKEPRYQSKLESKHKSPLMSSSNTSTLLLESNHFGVPLSPSIFVPEIKIETDIHNRNEDDLIEPDDDTIMREANLPPFTQNETVFTSTLAPLITDCETKNDHSNTFRGLHFMALNPAVTANIYDPLRPFHCSMCSKYFKRQDDLSRHMRVHSAEKPFICQECKKGFKRSDHLKKHMNTHTRFR